MTKLAYLHEAGVLYNLQRRYALNDIYVSFFSLLFRYCLRRGLLECICILNFSFYTAEGTLLSQIAYHMDELSSWTRSLWDIHLWSKTYFHMNWIQGFFFAYVTTTIFHFGFWCR